MIQGSLRAELTGDHLGETSKGRLGQEGGGAGAQTWFGVGVEAAGPSRSRPTFTPAMSGDPEQPT